MNDPEMKNNNSRIISVKEPYDLAKFEIKGWVPPTHGEDPNALYMKDPSELTEEERSKEYYSNLGKV